MYAKCRLNSDLNPLQIFSKIALIKKKLRYYSHGLVKINPCNAEAIKFRPNKDAKIFENSKPCHVGIHCIALTKYSEMSTHVPAFQSFSAFLHHFVLAKLDTSSVRVAKIDLPVQASTLTQNDTAPVGPVTPSIYWSCKMFTGPTFFL